MILSQLASDTEFPNELEPPVPAGMRFLQIPLFRIDFANILALTGGAVCDPVHRWLLGCVCFKINYFLLVLLAFWLSLGVLPATALWPFVHQ